MVRTQLVPLSSIFKITVFGKDLKKERTIQKKATNMNLVGKVVQGNNGRNRVEFRYHRISIIHTLASGLTESSFSLDPVGD